ncbi:MAG: AI-2E family transporter [Desulfobulbaceae bacterium]|nr:AI-2E family transporter [Desulfobulbaceae bacterium]
MSRQAPIPLQLFYLLILLVVSILFLWRILWPFFPCLLLALFLADIFRPVYAGLKRFLPSGLAALVTCLLMTLVLVVPLVLFVEALSNGAFSPACAVPGVGASIRESPYWARLPELAAILGLQLEAETISAMVAEVGEEVYRFVSSHAGGWAVGLLRLLMQFLVMILTAFFVLIDRQRFTSFWLRLSPLSDEQNRKLTGQLRETARAVLIGNGVGSLIQGVVGGLLFAWLGLPSPLLWGFGMTVLAFLPIVGIGVVMLPAGIFLFFQGNMDGVILLVVVYLFLTLLVEYLLKAKLTGDQAHMHSLLAFLAIIGGLESFGIMGIVYGPLIVTFFTSLAGIYLTDYLPAVQGRGGQGVGLPGPVAPVAPEDSTADPVAPEWPQAPQPR